MSGNLVYVGIGSNLGDKKKFCLTALELMSAFEGVKLNRVSSFYRSAPLGDVEQDWYLNAVAEISTSLSPRELLAALHLIENQLHRARETHWGPRTIDLDILFYNQEMIDEPGLIIPHPHAHQRNFVLYPLLEIAPDFIHPRTQTTIHHLVQERGNQDDCFVLPSSSANHFAGERS